MIPNVELLAKDEIFKTVCINNEIYENYLISNYGRLYSLNNMMILSKRKSNDGYLRSRLYKNGKIKYISTHRLVAFAFVKNPYPQYFNTVNHKDENKLNPKWDNLEWCDDKYNLNYGTAVERRKMKCNKTVLQYDIEKNHISTFDSLCSVEKYTGLSRRTIARYCHSGKSCKDYYFSYAG